MGTFTAPIEIGDPDRSRWIQLDALVDTGASISAVPGSILRDLGVSVLMTQEFEFGQGEIRRMNVGQTWIRIEGREVITLLLFNDEGTTPLLGAMTLEGVFLGVDPSRRRLVPTRGLLMQASPFVPATPLLRT
jgi:clan AA aspartic protease